METRSKTGRANLNPQGLTHDQLQQQCSVWVWNNIHQVRGRIHAINQNPVNGRQGATLKGLGFHEGVWDMMLGVPENNLTIWIEFKVGKDKLSKAQLKFKEVFDNPNTIWVIIETFEEFTNLIYKHYGKV